MADTSIRVRRAGPEDWDDIVQVDQLAFVYSYERDPRGGDGEPPALEIERTHLATIGDEPVGLASAYSLDLSVPGGSQPTAGVTWVGVVPTARRRGVLSELMREQLRDVRARGEHLAALFSSEPGIYGRFGYGVGSHSLMLTVNRGDGAVDGPPHDHLRARMTSVAQARDGVTEVYDAVRLERAGVPARDDDWWVRSTIDPPGERGGASEVRALLVDEPGGRTLAYALFNGKEDWSTGSGSTRVRVTEALSTDAAGATLLWRTMLNLDLVGRVEIRSLAVDDPLLHLLRNPRRAQPLLRDQLHVRLVDLAAALVGRAYDVAWTGVVEVSDSCAPWNEGRWRLVLGPDDLAVERTDDEADLGCDVRELGAVFLGGGSLVARARAGHVVERTPGAVAGLDRTFRHQPAPYCPLNF